MTVMDDAAKAQLKATEPNALKSEKCLLSEIDICEFKVVF